MQIKTPLSREEAECLAGGALYEGMPSASLSDVTDLLLAVDAASRKQAQERADTLEARLMAVFACYQRLYRALGHTEHDDDKAPATAAGLLERVPNLEAELAEAHDAWADEVLALRQAHEELRRELAIQEQQTDDRTEEALRLGRELDKARQAQEPLVEALRSYLWSCPCGMPKPTDLQELAEWAKVSDACHCCTKALAALKSAEQSSSVETQAYAGPSIAERDRFRKMLGVPPLFTAKAEEVSGE